MSDEAREEIIAEALEPLLRDGEAFQVYRDKGEVHVLDIGTSMCAILYPRLYGRLLSLSTIITNAGVGIGRIPLLLAGLFCIGIRMRWWEDFMSAPLLAKLDNGWFFVLVFFLVLSILQTITGWLQKQAYRRHRDDLFRLMEESNVDRDELITLISEDENVERVAWYLELDTEAQP